MRSTGDSLSRLRADMQLYPQVLVNVPSAKKVDLESNDQIQQAVKNAESELGDSGRILLRPSGTEPLVRVMVEGKVANDVEQICHSVAKVVGEALG